MKVALETESLPVWNVFIRREGHSVQARDGKVFIDGSEAAAYTVERDMYQPDMAQIVLANWGDHYTTQVKIGDPVEVKVQYTYNWLHYLTDANVPIVGRILPNTSKQITGTATMRLEQKPTNYSVSDNPAGCT